MTICTVEMKYEATFYFVRSFSLPVSKTANTRCKAVPIRELTRMGVAVYFEKESVNTLESTGELLITILSSQAQEESRNISENCHWGIVRQFENGVVRVNCKKFMGYTKDADGNLVIVPEEAELVRRIFRLFLEGNSSIKIKQALEADKILTAIGKTEWHPTVIDEMLSNEKYMGDALLQKTYTLDFFNQEESDEQGNRPAILCER